MQLSLHHSSAAFCEDSQLLATGATAQQIEQQEKQWVPSFLLF